MKPGKKQMNVVIKEGSAKGKNVDLICNWDSKVLHKIQIIFRMAFLRCLIQKSSLFMSIPRRT